MPRTWGDDLTVLEKVSCTFICIFSQILATKYRGSRLVVSCNHRFLNNLFSASTLTLIHHLRNGILQNLLEVCFMWLETVFLSELVVKFPASHDHTCDTLVVEISGIRIQIPIVWRNSALLLGLWGCYEHYGRVLVIRLGWHVAYHPGTTHNNLPPLSPNGQIRFKASPHYMYPAGSHMSSMFT